MKYTIEKVENGYICIVFDFKPVSDEGPKLYVFKKRNRVIEWLDGDLQ